MKILKRFIYIDFMFIAFFVIGFVLFPKTNLYFGFEKELKKYEIIISDETIIERSFGLQLIDGNIYAQGIKSINFKEANIDFKIYRNTIDIKSISPFSALKSMVPDILYISLSHSIFNPTIIHIKSLSSEWSIRGFVDIKNRKINIVLIPKKNFKRREFLNLFTKTTKGNYKYEQKF